MMKHSGFDVSTRLQLVKLALALALERGQRTYKIPCLNNLNSLDFQVLS